MKIFLLTAASLLATLSFAQQAFSSIDNGRFIGLRAGQATQASQLTGTGFNSDLPGADAILYDAELSYQLSEKPVRFSLRYFKTSASQNVATVSPSSVDVDFESYRFLVSSEPWHDGAFSNVRFGVGFAAVEQGGTDTATYNVLTNQKSQGLMLALGHTAEPLPKLVIDTEASFYAPYKLTESPQITGFNRTSWAAEIKCEANYLVTPGIAVLAGIGYRYDVSSYEGTGTRGVTSGKDTRTLLTLPIGVKIGY